jgi:hypothetical protein
MRGLSDKSKTSLAGLLALGVGIGLLLAVNFDPEAAKAPVWVVNAAAMCFVFAGCSVLANGIGWPLVSRLSGAAVAWMLAVPGLWMLFDGQGVQCAASIDMGGLSAASAAASGLCRAVFGIGGLVTLAIAIAFTWLAFRPHQSGTGKTDGEVRSNV